MHNAHLEYGQYTQCTLNSGEHIWIASWIMDNPKKWSILHKRRKREREKRRRSDSTLLWRKSCEKMLISWNEIILMSMLNVAIQRVASRSMYQRCYWINSAVSIRVCVCVCIFICCIWRINSKLIRMQIKQEKEHKKTSAFYLDSLA